MTLAVSGPRSSLLRSVADAFDLYDNPDTPGTTYSFQEFQEPPRLSQTMQAENASLGIPMTDSQHFAVTDDEMLDSDDVDVRRDEDLDIEDIDAAEVYSVAGGVDLEENYVMEDDAVDYSAANLDQDNDDVMLDDPELEEDMFEEHVQDANGIANQTNEPVNTTNPGQSADALDFRHLATPIATTQSPYKAESVPSPRPETVDAAPADDSILSENTALEHSNPDGSADALNNNLKSIDPVLDDAQGHFPQAPSENAWSDDRSATLSNEPHLADENTSPAGGVAPESTDAPGEEVQEAQEHDYTSTDAPGPSHAAVTSYPHPVVVTYESAVVSLFPPPDLSDEDVVRSPYQDVPTQFFIEDMRACDKGLDQMFVQLRKVLVDDIRDEDELVMEVDPLGLVIGEDNPECSTVSFRTILDLHVQLYRQDGTDNPPPVNMILLKRQRFWKRVQLLSLAAQEGKGLVESLHQCGDDYIDDATSIAEENGITDETNTHASGSESPFKGEQAEPDISETQNEEVLSDQREEQVNIPDGEGAYVNEKDKEFETGDVDLSADSKPAPSAGSDSGHGRDTETPNRAPEPEGNATTMPAGHNDLRQSTGGSQTSEHVDDEEELLEYEDDEPEDHGAQESAPHKSPEEHSYDQTNPVNDQQDPQDYQNLQEYQDPQADQSQHDQNQHDQNQHDQNQHSHQEQHHDEDGITNYPPPDEAHEHSVPEQQIPVVGGDDDDREDAVSTGVPQEHYDEYGYGDEHERYQADEATYELDEQEFEQDAPQEPDYFETTIEQGDFEYPQNADEVKPIEGEPSFEEFDDMGAVEDIAQDIYTADYDEEHSNAHVATSYENYQHDQVHIAENATKNLVATLDFVEQKDGEGPTQDVYVEEELIEYVDDGDDEVAQDFTDMSPGASKRIREDPEEDNDGEVDDLQTAKRVRSE